MNFIKKSSQNVIKTLPYFFYSLPLPKTINLNFSCSIFFIFSFLGKFSIKLSSFTICEQFLLAFVGVRKGTHEKMCEKLNMWKIMSSEIKSIDFSGCLWQKLFSYLLAAFCF